MPLSDKALMCRWLSDVAGAHGFETGAITYMFCSDDEILKANREYLGHDYYTDVITFDYTRGQRISGDILISLDTVATNAAVVGAAYADELHRVIVHGVLHLCGINDKAPGEREVMQRHEDEALEMLDKMMP